MKAEPVASNSVIDIIGEYIQMKGVRMHTKSLGERKQLLAPPESVKLKSGCIVLKPGEAVGAHTTDAREEVLVILEGTATVDCAGETTSINAPGFAYIAPQQMHNVTNNAETDLKYVYVVAPVGGHQHQCRCGGNGSCQSH